MSKQYAERDIESLDEAGGFYSRHVSAMTGEGLYTKSSIAAELGYRDMVNSELLEALQMALEWIDAVPSDTLLPAMPGFDRDEVNSIIIKATGETK